MERTGSHPSRKACETLMLSASPRIDALTYRKSNPSRGLGDGVSAAGFHGAGRCLFSRVSTSRVRGACSLLLRDSVITLSPSGAVWRTVDLLTPVASRGRLQWKLVALCVACLLRALLTRPRSMFENSQQALL